MHSTKWVAIVTLLLLIVGTGCSRNLSRDVKADVKRSLEQAGLIDVKVDQDLDTGVVTLSGQVKSDDEKARAETVAKAVAGDQVVSNQIAVRPPGFKRESKGIASETDAGYSSQASESTATSTTVVAYMIIPSGTELALRTNETIDSKTATAGQTFSALMDRDVLDSSGALAISKGSNAELVIRSAAGGSATKTSSLVLDVDTITVAGKRYAVSTGDVQQKGRQGLGANKRTAEMVGGGAAIGALIGAIAGKGKGAAIGAGVGAAAGAGTQVLTKGKQVQVPAETILAFKLEQDLRLEPAR